MHMQLRWMKKMRRGKCSSITVKKRKNVKGPIDLSFFRKLKEIIKLGNKHD